MKSLYKFPLIILALVTILSGCTGSVLRGGMTDKTTYQETLHNISDVKAGKGRVFIYVPKGGPDIISTLGVIDFISIDNEVYRFGGESYFYLDIKSGPHHVTVTEVVKAGLKNKKQYGKNNLDISTPGGEVLYLRIMAYKSRAYNLEVVPKKLAESEMNNLPLWTNSSTTMEIE
ncbi:MAG: hypothetical protein V7752_18035 [Halopseudomonas sp.]